MWRHGKKTVFSFAESEDPQFVKKIADCSERLDGNPEDVDLMKKIGFLFLKGNYILQAQEHLGQALQADPNDDKVKLAYAETTLKMNQMDAVAIQGKKNRLNLYEILGLKRALDDREKIPQERCDQHEAEVEKLVEYPEDIVLPAESLDGSVGHSRVVGFLSYAIADGLGPERSGEIGNLTGGLSGRRGQGDYSPSSSQSGRGP